MHHGFSLEMPSVGVMSDDGLRVGRFVQRGGLLGAGLLGCWFAGLLVCWFAGLLGLLVCWFAGLLVCWFAGFAGSS
jgi:hypothetical protein